jgi:WD40 repeat protein
MAGEGVAFSPDSKIMVTGQGLWLEAGKKDARTVDMDAKGLPHFAPDGKTLAVVRLPLFRLSLRIEFLDVATWKVRQSIAADASSLPYAVAFTPDWKLLACANMMGGVTLWDVAGGRVLGTLPSTAGCVAISPDGKKLATEKNGAISLWDLGRLHESAREMLRPAVAPSENGVYITCLAFSPDGKTLAAASGSPYAGATPGDVTLWDLATRTVRTRLRGHTGPVSAVAYSPDGRTLATGSYDRTVRLWDAVTAEYLVTLKGHPSPVTAVVFRPDGKALAAVGRDLSLRVWSAETEPPVQ